MAQVGREDHPLSRTSPVWGHSICCRDWRAGLLISEPPGTSSAGQCADAEVAEPDE